jgi:hypothetical protein
MSSRVTRLALAGEALVALALASAAIRLLPFRRVVRLAAWRRRSARSRETQALAWAVDAAARRVPWKAVCFQQGLALHWMLRLRGVPSVLRYGIAHAPDGLTAHVWVTVDDRIVIGARGLAGHRLVASYPEPA